jgi:hypothetical protein
MRVMFSANGTSPCYPSTVRPALVRRIPTGGQEVLPAASVATGESSRNFAVCRGRPAGKVYAGGMLARVERCSRSGDSRPFCRFPQGKLRATSKRITPREGRDYSITVENGKIPGALFLATASKLPLPPQHYAIASGERVEVR